MSNPSLSPVQQQLWSKIETQFEQLQALPTSQQIKKINGIHRKIPGHAENFITKSANRLAAYYATAIESMEEEVSALDVLMGTVNEMITAQSDKKRKVEDVVTADKMDKRPRTDYVLVIGSQVAAMTDITKTNEWILATVIQHNVAVDTYVVEDAEDDEDRPGTRKYVSSHPDATFSPPPC